MFPQAILKSCQGQNLQTQTSRKSGSSEPQRIQIQPDGSRNTENQLISPVLKIKREKYPIWLYTSYIFASTLLPLVNLLTLFTQSYNLSWENNFASINRKNFEFYYIGIGYYVASNVIFLFCSAQTTLPLKQLLKMYFLVDSNQICMIAACICYVALHLVYLCRDLAGNYYDIKVVDIFYLIALVINNFCFLGHFRTTLICYKWTPVMTLTFKILVFTSSLSYFAYGIMLIIGEDNLSHLLVEANNIVESFVQSNDFGNLTAEVRLELLQQISNLSVNISTIQNLIGLFVFTSFANICQVLDRMNDFDKSSDLKPMYLIDDDEDEGPKIEELKNHLHSQIKDIFEQARNIDLLKDALTHFLEPQQSRRQGNVTEQRPQDSINPEI